MPASAQWIGQVEAELRLVIWSGQSGERGPVFQRRYTRREGLPGRLRHALRQTQETSRHRGGPRWACVYFLGYVAVGANLDSK